MTCSKLHVKFGVREGMVDRDEYVRAKTRQLREFGYDYLTEKHVDEQVDALLQGKAFGKGLTVIGKFMEGEVIQNTPICVNKEVSHASA